MWYEERNIKSSRLKTTSKSKRISKDTNQIKENITSYDAMSQKEIKMNCWEKKKVFGKRYIRWKGNA